jgi:hypothetical protein
MPEIIWKVENNQFELFKFFDNEVWHRNDNFTFYVLKIIELMNQKAKIIFANYTFSDNFWEVLDEDKIDYIYENVILENINKLSFTECYNLLYILTCQKWIEEDNKIFTFMKLKKIIKQNDLRLIRKKLYYAISDCIIYSEHIENIVAEHYNKINGINTTNDSSIDDYSIQSSSRICYKIQLKNNSNTIAKNIYEKIGHTKNIDKDTLINTINNYILNHLNTHLYGKEYLEKVIYEYGIQNAIEEFIINSKNYDNIITLLDNDLSKLYLGIVYYIISESFEYMSFIRSSL